MGVSRLTKFWLRTSYVLCAMATYKAATGFTALVIPLVLEQMPAIDKEDEVQFNFWVSLQVLALYLGEAIGEFLTGVLTDKHPLLLKKMLLVVLFFAGISYVGQGLAVHFLIDQPLEISMTTMTFIRFFNGFFSPAVQGSLASFQLVERYLAWGTPEKGDLRSKVENMRPVALYLGDVAGCIFIALAGVVSLPVLFYLVALSNFLMLLCIWVSIPDPIFSGTPQLTEQTPNLQESDPLLSKEKSDGETNGNAKKDPPPLKGPNWWLFKYYVWNRAVIFIFLANMMNSLFNSIVAADQILHLDISEILLAAENLFGSLLGVAVAWGFMTYLYKRLGSTKSLHISGILSALSLAGMPWFILSILWSVLISIVYTPVIITQDAIAIISGASFAVKTIDNSEGFAYGFLNSVSMIACGIAPFVYTALLSFLSKTAVWLVLAAFYVVMIFAEVVNQINQSCRKRSQVKSDIGSRASTPYHGSSIHTDDHDSSRAETPAVFVVPPLTRERSKSFNGSFSKYLPEVEEEGRQRSQTYTAPEPGDVSPRMRKLSAISNTKLAFATSMIGQGNQLMPYQS